MVSDSTPQTIEPKKEVKENQKPPEGALTSAAAGVDLSKDQVPGKGREAPQQKSETPGEYPKFTNIYNENGTKSDVAETSHAKTVQKRNHDDRIQSTTSTGDGYKELILSDKKGHSTSKDTLYTDDKHGMAAGTVTHSRYNEFGRQVSVQKINPDGKKETPIDLRDHTIQ